MIKSRPSVARAKSLGDSRSCRRVTQHGANDDWSRTWPVRAVPGFKGTNNTCTLVNPGRIRVFLVEALNNTKTSGV